MRGTSNKRSIQYKREVVATIDLTPEPVGGGQQGASPCDNMPSASATKPALLAWLSSAGVEIEDPSSLDKSELWGLVNDFCD